MKKENTININGNNIYYFEKGNGKTIIMVHGAIFDADFFDRTSDYLSDKYRVIAFDRRGYSRSSGETCNETLWEDHISDLTAFIETVSPNEKVILVGSSMGSVISLLATERRPDLVECIIAHEPPLLRHLPKESDYWNLADDIRATIEKRRYNSALLKFLSLVGKSDDRAPAKSDEQQAREFTNVQVFMKNEFSSTFTPFDKDPVIDKSVKVAIGVGDGHQDNYHYTLGHRYAEENGYLCIDFPGQHNAGFELPLDFAVNILGILSLFNI